MTDTPEAVALKPCPFCGSGPAIPFGQGPGQASFSGVEMMRGVRGRHFVQCGTCGAQSLSSFHDGAAIENWNSRPDANIVRQLVEALDFYAANHEWPNEGPWGVDSTDFGDVARKALTTARAAGYGGDHG